MAQGTPWKTLQKQKLLELKSEFCKDLGNKVNVQKSTVFQSVRDEQLETSFKNTIYNSVKRCKKIRVKLTKDGQDLDAENHKILLREMKEADWIPCLQVRRSSVLSRCVCILTISMYRVLAILINIFSRLVFLLFLFFW